jgi:hypothetical protein
VAPPAAALCRAIYSRGTRGGGEESREVILSISISISLANSLQTYKMVRLVNLQRKEREKGTEIGTIMVLLLLFANHVNT